MVAARKIAEIKHHRFYRVLGIFFHILMPVLNHCTALRNTCVRKPFFCVFYRSLLYIKRKHPAVFPDKICEEKRVIAVSGGCVDYRVAGADGSFDIFV